MSRKKMKRKEKKKKKEKYENGEYGVDTLVIVGGHLLGEVLVKGVNVEEIDKQRRLFRGDEHPEQPVVVVLAERVLPPELLADGVERGGVGRGVHDVADGVSVRRWCGGRRRTS